MSVSVIKNIVNYFTLIFHLLFSHSLSFSISFFIFLIPTYNYFFELCVLFTRQLFFYI